MFGLIAIHDDTALGLELPSSLVYVEHHDIHAQVHGGLLGREAGAEARIEEEHEQRFVLTQVGIGKTVALNLQGLGYRSVEVANISYTGKFFHRDLFFNLLFLGFQQIGGSA